MRRLFLFLTLLCHATGIWAGGLQGCMERVLAFQAYEIDELNTPGDRIMGYSCSRWDGAARTCTGTWNACQGSLPGGRCNYDEFQMTTRGLPRHHGWAVYHPGTNRLDADATSRLCHQRFFAARGPRGVPDFKSYHVMKGANGEWNAYINRLGQVMDDTASNYRTNANRDKFTDWDANRERVAVLRVADHHKHLIPAMETYFGNALQIHYQDLGPDPLNPGERLRAVDFKTTVLAARHSPARGPGEVEIGRRLRFFLNGYYRAHTEAGVLTEASKAASQHLTVLRSYRKVADRTRSCRV